MKKSIHPKYNAKIKASCACGHSFETGSTEAEIKTDICANCHPFYTGKQKLLDTARRAEKFHAKVAKQKEVSKERATKKVKRAAKAIKKAAK
ncbi:MAG TPA: 50S ribosomal protein L31 [bacterium]|nr:50S ribosomal protein L31 [bacterium]HPT29638.1 50S ribosomal protein L31 [bacterium]